MGWKAFFTLQVVRLLDGTTMAESDKHVEHVHVPHPEDTMAARESERERQRAKLPSSPSSAFVHSPVLSIRLRCL